MSVKVFYTSVTGSREIRGNQDKIFSVLDGQGIAYETVDISQNSDLKDLMRDKAGKPTAVPPQIFNGDVYCGDFAAFDHAVEMEDIKGFLKI